MARGKEEVGGWVEVGKGEEDGDICHNINSKNKLKNDFRKHKNKNIAANTVILQLSPLSWMQLKRCFATSRSGL